MATSGEIIQMKSDTVQDGHHIKTDQVKHEDHFSTQSQHLAGHHARQLTEADIDKLKKQDSRPVSEYKQMKLEREAQKSWDLFYKRNTTNFYKDRHWTTREFQELCSSKDKNEKLVVLECGCGVGNFMFPLLEENPNVVFYACDFSVRAIQFVKDHPLFDSDRCSVFHCDLTSDDLANHVPTSSVHIVSLIFVLSAIHPDKMVQTLRNIYKVVADDGFVIFRDYGLYDEAMLRFAPGSKLQDCQYVRQDNTRAYYFSEEKLAELFTTAGFHVDRNQYVLRETVNKKEGVSVPRVFIQGKFTKKNTTLDAPV